MDLSSVFGKKVGGFNKKGIWKPDIYWLKDSERLWMPYGGKVFAVNNDFELPTKDLRLIEIKSKKIKSIAKGSFSGLSSKVVIKVPKSRKKKYTKMLRKSGLEKKVKIRTL